MCIRDRSAIISAVWLLFSFDRGIVCLEEPTSLARKLLLCVNNTFFHFKSFCLTSNQEFGAFPDEASGNDPTETEHAFPVPVVSGSTELAQ